MKSLLFLLCYIRSEDQKSELNKGNNNSAYVKVMHDKQKLLPVVTVVLYFGKGKWERPLTLSDMLEIPESQKEFWNENLNDHEIKVIHNGIQLMSAKISAAIAV